MHWAVTASPSHPWETLIMATTVTNRLSAPSSHGPWELSHLLSLALLLLQLTGSAHLWDSITLVPWPTLMPLWSLKTRASGHPACTPTTRVPGAGAAAWGWREAPSPQTSENITKHELKLYFIFINTGYPHHTWIFWSLTMRNVVIR